MITVFSAKAFRLNPEQLLQLYDIVIQAYAATEKEIWGQNYVRISFSDFTEFVENDEILFALMDGKIVGGVRYFQLDNNTWSFSLLGSDFNHAGKGIGRALIDKVEELVKAKGGIAIHIEVLRAIGVEVTSKERLKAWYIKMGYELVKTVDVFEVYDNAEKWSKLVNPSEFDCYLKKLEIS